MIGKKPPIKAIAEAQRWAGEQGLMVFALEPEGIFPFHFIVSDKGRVSLVFVRHPKYLDFNINAIDYSCRTAIAQLRALPVSNEIHREIWVRRTASMWYRYRVLTGSIESIDNAVH